MIFLRHSPLSTAVLLFTLFGSSNTFAWTPLTDGGAGSTLGSVSRWDLNKLEDGRIPYRVNLARPAGAVDLVPADVSNQQLLDEIFGGLQIFTELTDSDMKFRFDGETDNDWGFDQQNVITFKAEGFDDFRGGPAFIRVTSAISPGAVMRDDGSIITASLPGEILDADIIFDPSVSFEVGQPGPTGSNLLDLRGFITAAIGLAVGVDGSGLTSSVFRTIGLPRQGYDSRRLALDDHIAFAALYPTSDFLTARGRITGTVTNSNGEPVFGAHVVAIDAATGVVVTSTLTGLVDSRPDSMPARFSATSGNYSLVGLPPGEYRILVEPLDGPNQGLINGVFGDPLDNPVVDIDFATTERPGSTSASAGVSTDTIDVQVNDRTLVTPNLSPFVFMTNEDNVFFESARLAGGATRSLSMSGENLQNGTTLVADTNLLVSGTGVTIDAVTARATDILATLTVAAGAEPGPRVLTWSNVNGTATVAGAITVLPTPNPEILPFASVLPSSRAVSVGTTATAFASVINAGAVDALDCRISPQTAVPGDFFFQPTDPATNATVGTRNAPVNIPAGAAQSFVIGFTPTAPLDSTPVGLGFVCGEVNEAPSFVGLNTLQLAASTTPVADIVALGATPLNDGIVHLPGTTATGFFTVATVNLGATADIEVSVDTGEATLAATYGICQTDPETSVCINPTAPTDGPVSLSIDTNETPTFAVFVTGQDVIPLDPAASRIFLRFRDSDGLETGSTSVAVETDS